jgi:hypothetical protein
MQVTSNGSYHSSNSMCSPFPKRMTQQNNNCQSSDSGAWQPTSFSNSRDGYLLSKSFQRCGNLALNPIKALSMRSLFSFEELDFLTHHWVKLTTPSALDFCSIQGNQLWPRIPSSLPPSIPPPKIDQILVDDDDDDVEKRGKSRPTLITYLHSWWSSCCQTILALESLNHNNNAFLGNLNRSWIIDMCN